MPQIKLDAHQLVDALEERLNEANSSVVVANVAAAFQRYSDAHEGEADYYPDVASWVAYELRCISDRIKRVESGTASLPPKLAPL